jgi:4-hydroxy-2-oxoheptanedioate aldolase
VGTFVKLPGAAVIDCLHGAGLDFAVLDLEHAGPDEGEALAQLAHAHALGFPVVVRLPEVDPPAVTRLLEAGAAGVQIADVRTAADATRLVRATRFAPGGDRGVSMSHRAAGFGALSAQEYVAGAAGVPFVVIQIEAALGDELDGVLVDGVDVAFVGTMDLSARLGVPGRLDDPLVIEEVERIADAAARAGVALGAPSPAPPEVPLRYRTLATDATTLRTAFVKLAAGARTPPS